MSKPKPNRMRMSINVKFVMILMLTFLLLLLLLGAKCDDNQDENVNLFSYKKHSTPSEDDDYESDSDELATSSSAEDMMWWGNRMITADDKLHDCGNRDRCPENATTIQSAIISPEICRCDLDQCLKYGDCCWSLIENKTRTEERNLWQCQLLENQETSATHALMISECPESSPDQITKQLCQGQNIPPENYTYLVDLPVYSNKSAMDDNGNDDDDGGGGGTLYKNIYCARCHNEKNTHIVPWTMQLACNQEFTPTERSEFMRSARYEPGKRLWKIQKEDNDNDNSTTTTTVTKCVLKIAELVTEFDVQSTIPNVRYCPSRAIATCPQPNATSISSPLHNKTFKMCTSYAQYVMHRETGVMYKNPHCALCHFGYEIPQQPFDPYPIPLTCRKPSVATTFFKVRPGEAGANLPGAGLNFLFDFGLGSNKYVGYEMLCGDDEIWDYIRQKCGPMICKSGYSLKKGECIPIILKPPLIEIIARPPPPPSNSNSTSGEGGGGGSEDGRGSYNNRTTDYDNHDDDDDDDGRSGNNDDDPECTKYRILLHEHEYKVLENPPNAISIILPNMVEDGTEEEEPIILRESEYEYVNETTISICAKFLHHAFKFTFSTTLNYLSLISVGLSVIFSALHILLYLILPKLRNPPGRNLFCLTASLFIFQILFLALFTHDKWPELCVISAIVMHYFSLAAFFWMNIMSFDMWRTFSCNSLLRSSHSTDGQKFFKYSIYAWFMPGLIVLVAILLDFAVPEPDTDTFQLDDDDLLSTVRPSYGENGLCWITQRLSLFIFFAIPVAIVITVNIVLFSCTANAIFSQHKESSKVFKNKSKKVPVPVSAASNSKVSIDKSSTVATVTTATTTNGSKTAENGKVSSSSSKKGCAHTHATNRDKIRLMLYVNMALIMGLGWILGFASQFLATDWLRYPFVIINGLQGTFIFFAFDFKRKIWRMLRDQFYDGKLGKMFGLERSTSSMGIGDTTTNSSSNRRTTRSSNLLSSTTMMSMSEDEKRRRISLSVK